MEELFTSKTLVKILKLFLKNPKRRFYQSELPLKLGESLGAIQYEVKRLEKIGFLDKKTTKVRTFYWLNKKFPYIRELKSLLKI